MTTDNLLLSSGEAGFILRLSSQRVRELADRGDIPHVRTSRGERLFYRADVEAYGAAREQRRSAAPDDASE